MKEIINECMKDTLRNVKVILNMGITDEEKINKLKPLVFSLECGSEGRGRINKHMKNTLRDIKSIFNKRITPVYKFFKKITHKAFFVV